MRTPIRRDPSLRRAVLSVAVLSSVVALAAELNEFKTLAVAPSSTGVTVRVEGQQAPVFTVFRLQDPDRLVVDVSTARRGSLADHYEGTGPVSGVVVSQFSEAGVDVARLLIGLEDATGYDVRADGQALIISVEGGKSPRSPAIDPRDDRASEPAQPKTPAPVEASQPQPVVSEVAVKDPGSRVLSLALTRNGLKVRTDGEVGRFEVLELENPSRLALDLPGFTGPVKSPRLSGGLVKTVRVGSEGGRYRVVLEVVAGLPKYEVKRVGHGLFVSLGATAERPRAVSAAPEIVLDGDAVGGGIAQLEALQFREEGSGGRVELTLAGEAGWKVERPDSHSAVLTLEGIKMPHRLERSLDTSDLQGLVKMVSAFPVPGETNRVRVVVAGTGVLGESVVVKPGALTWHFRRGEQEVEAKTGEAKSAGLSVEATQVALEGAPQRPRYVGKKVSFEFKDIDIHNLLRIIAEISKKNIVVADDVSGKVTIRLRNVPWDQALDLVLRSKSLGQEDLGNILRVAPLTKLEEEAASRVRRRDSEFETRELSVQLVPVNYATAGEMAARVKEVLTKRGNVAVDARTNTLIVRDLPENMQRVRSLVSSLDLQTPQVLIESRIVEANVRFQREVGVQWGGQAVMATSNGNPTGLQFPNSIAATGGIPAGGATAGVSPTPQYAVSLPVGAGDGSGGALGLVFGSAGSAATLNLRLSALESQGSIKTISAPRVTTLDNRQARISQGLSIPFSQTSAAGANTVFVDAILQLAVTPHVTQDGSILMDVIASNNSPDLANSGANGQPGIARKEAATNVLVKDGDTTVIGGIYVRRGSSTQAGLPLLSKIPVLGFFFRNSRELETKDELLIFISPRILNRQTIAQN